MFGIIGHCLLLQLPLKNRYQHLVHNYGAIKWEDIDWAEFMDRDYGKPYFVVIRMILTLERFSSSKSFQSSL